MADSIAVITGFGAGLSEGLALRLMQTGYTVAGLSRSESFGRQFQSQHPDRFRSYACDVGDEAAVVSTFAQIKTECGAPNLLIHNAAQLVLRDFLEIAAAEFEALWRTSCLGATLATQQVLPDMLAASSGTLIFTGATASVKAGPKSAAFAASKFALRGLAQSLARAYGPRGVHVVHTVIDGVIRGDRAQNEFGMPLEKCMDPDDLVEAYMALIAQKPSSWTHEVDFRPAGESF
ncbi:MAG: SDR family NAD(P)-dependent oxidoreductase [bacterium]|nr:SDR family NAD(P)-dependent oxidoreductase [bacterium]